jgi:aspartate carbamoyltransferase catalytic subunit
MKSFMGRDILSLKEFERNEFSHVFEVAKALEPIAKSRRNSDLLKDKTLVTAFYQPSTRTRLAHEAAMHRLGGHVTGFADAKMTRAGDFYQESIKDTVKMLEYYGDVIVINRYTSRAKPTKLLVYSCPVFTRSPPSRFPVKARSGQYYHRQVLE